MTNTASNAAQEICTPGASPSTSFAKKCLIGAALAASLLTSVTTFLAGAAVGWFTIYTLYKRINKPVSSEDFHKTLSLAFGCLAVSVGMMTAGNPLPTKHDTNYPTVLADMEKALAISMLKNPGATNASSNMTVKRDRLGGYGWPKTEEITMRVESLRGHEVSKDGCKAFFFAIQGKGDGYPASYRPDPTSSGKVIECKR